MSILNSSATNASTKIPLEERRERLAQEITRQLALGNRRLESQSDLSAVIVIGKPVNHILHLLLTIVTFGIWLIPWAIMHNFGGEKRELFWVKDDGRVLSQSVK